MILLTIILFEPSNKLVLVGCLEDNGQEHLFNMDVPDGIYLQELLDRATIIIGHNIAYDLMWLWETGYKYDGPVFDTMLAENVLKDMSLPHKKRTHSSITSLKV